MGAYIARRVLLMIPTILGIMLISFVIVQFAPGGPVERIIAQLQGHDTGATGALFRRRQRSRPERRDASGGRRRRNASSKYRGAQGLDPKFIAELEKQFGFDKPAWERFLLMVKNYAMFDFGRSYFRDESVLKLIGQKLPVSMSLGLWMTLLSYSISIPLGIAKAVRDGTRFDAWTSTVIIVGYAIPSFLFAMLLIVLFAGGSFWQIFPLRGLTSDDFDQLSLLGKVERLSLAHRAAGVCDDARRLRHADLSDQELLPRRNPQAICADRADEGPDRTPRALRPCVPQRHADRRSPAFPAPSSTPSSPARC